MAQHRSTTVTTQEQDRRETSAAWSGAPYRSLEFGLQGREVIRNCKEWVQFELRRNRAEILGEVTPKIIRRPPEISLVQGLSEIRWSLAQTSPLSDFPLRRCERQRGVRTPRSIPAQARRARLSAIHYQPAVSNFARTNPWPASYRRGEILQQRVRVAVAIRPWNLGMARMLLLREGEDPAAM